MRTIFTLAIAFSCFTFCAFAVFIDICPQIDCLPPKVYSPKTCDCVCPNVCTRKNFILNNETCECECAKVLKCTTFKVFDFTTCSCVCRKGISCRLPLVFNPNSCTCTCPPIICPTGQIPLLPGCQCGKPIPISVVDVSAPITV